MADLLDLRTFSTESDFVRYANLKGRDNRCRAIDSQSATRENGRELSRCNGYRSFVFDYVSVGKYVQTFPPIVYDFAAAQFYYPLRDSSVDPGWDHSS